MGIERHNETLGVPPARLGSQHIEDCPVAAVDTVEDADGESEGTTELFQASERLEQDHRFGPRPYSRLAGQR
jgi:hypothetical protein